MVLWLAALAGLAFYVLVTLHLCWLALGYPYQLDYGEGLVLHQTRLLAHGQSIYKGMEGYPYIFSNYPPLFPALVSPLVSLWGVSFLPGRLFAVASTLGIAAVLFALGKRLAGSRLAAIVGAMLFLGSPYVYHWAPLFRIVLPALFMCSLGLLVLAGRDRELTHARIARAALLFVLALYTKQSYVAAPAAVTVYLATRDTRALMKFLLSMAVLASVPFIIIELATHGAFSFGLFTANVNPFSLKLLLEQVRDFVTTFAGLFVLAAVGFAARGRHHRQERPWRSATLLHWYGIAALASILLAGKVGAWENYFFEALFALCLFAGLGLQRLAQAGSVRLRAVAPVLLLVQLALMWHDPRVGVQVITEDGAANAVLAPLIRQQSGMILSEDLGLLLVNGKDVPYFSFQYAQLAHVGRWDERWETESLRAGRFALVILERGTRENPERYRRFTHRFLSALDCGYGLIAEVGKYRVYAPQPLLREMNVVFGERVALLGYRLDAAATSGDGIQIPLAEASLPSLNPYPPRLRLTLIWQALARMDTSYKVFVHMEDLTGTRVAQSDAYPFFGLLPTNRWQEGDVVRDYLDLDLPSGLAPGRYVLRVGLYDPTSGQRLARADGGTSVLLAGLPLGLSLAAQPPQDAIRFGDGIALVAHSVSSERLVAGAPLTVTLQWQSSAYVGTDYTVFVHLAGADGHPLAQDDAQPFGGRYPTSVWHPGEVIADAHVVAVPSTVPAGTYRLLVGLYEQPSGRRVTVAGGGDHIILRTFIAP